MRRSGWTLSLVLGGALATLAPARAATGTAGAPQSGFAPALESIGIRDIQTQLAARGYDPGPATGLMSEATQRAIMAYQSDYGLAQDGIAGPVVQNALHFMARRPPPATLAALTPPAVAPRTVPPALAPPVAAPPVAAAPESPAPPAAAPAPPAPPAAADQADAAPAPVVAKEAALDSVPPHEPAQGPALGPLDTKPIAAPRTPVGVGPIAAGATNSAAAGAAPADAAIAPAAAAASIATPAVAVAAAPTVQDAPLATGDEAVRQAQSYLKELGFFSGEPDGVMDWPTAEALVKFDASGTGPHEVIADARHPDAMWLARLRTAAATKEAQEAAAKLPSP